MQVQDWLLLRCGRCSEHIKLPRGPAAAFARCPGCSAVLAVPAEASEPAGKFTVFTAAEGELPEGGGFDVPAPAPTLSPAPIPGVMRGSLVPRRSSVQAPLAPGGFGDSKPKLAPLKPAPDLSRAPARAGDPMLGGAGLDETGSDPGAAGVSGRSHTDGHGHGHGHGHGGERRKTRKRSRTGNGLGWEAPVMEGGHHNPNKIAQLFARFALVAIALLAIGFVALFTLKERDRRRGAEAAQGAAGGGGGQARAPGAAAAGAAAGTAEGGSDTLVEAGAEEEEITFSALTRFAERFLRAASVDELKPLVRDPDRVHPLMESYYQDHAYRPPGFRRARQPSEVNLDDPLIRLSAETESFNWVELVLRRDPESEAGFLVDWESFVGYSDMPWTEMLIEKPREAVVVRAKVSADAYFNFDFANEDQFLCVRLLDPQGQIQIYGYASRGSRAAADLQALLGSGSEVEAVLTVRYPEVAPASNQVVVDGVVTSGWIIGMDEAGVGGG